ncbi:MAG: phosphoesterase, partial [Planctomycetota bacterium]
MNNQPGNQGPTLYPIGAASPVHPPQEATDTDRPHDFHSASPSPSHSGTRRAVSRTLGRPDPISLYRPSTLMWLACITLSSVPLLPLIDLPVARWFAEDRLPGEISNALALTSIFTHGIGIFWVLVGIVLLAPRKRWHVPRLTALALGGFAVATIIKMFVLRPKPSLIDLEVATNDSAWFWAFDWTLANIATYDAGTRAFPS